MRWLVEALLQLDGPALVRYLDKRAGKRHAALLQNDAGFGATHLQACLLSGDTGAQDWVTMVLTDSLPAQDYSRTVRQSIAAWA